VKRIVTIWIVFAIPLLIGAYLRTPYLFNDLPYFYDEDEAHHINRTIDMAKSGDLNPHYFHKPSLHFYLRQITIELGLQWISYHGTPLNLEEVRTRDPYGLARYAFSASHPQLIPWVRLPSLIGSLLCIFCSAFIGFLLQGRSSALCAGMITALVPPLIENSGTVGVDTLMAAFCLMTTCVAMYGFQSRSQKLIALAALLAGCAASTKYNAAPIGIVPLAALFLLGERRIKPYVVLSLLPGITFIACSPFILIELFTFIEQIRYEMWHYAVAGHEGHSNKPGLAQALFYLTWFSEHSFGLLGTVLALVSPALYLFTTRAPNQRRLLVIAAIFPAVYIAFMCLQKVNFTRNMLVALPYLSAGIGIAANLMGTLVVHYGKNLQPRAQLIAPLTSLVMLALIGASAPLYPPTRATPQQESRSLLSEERTRWIKPEKEVAVDGELQLSAPFLWQRGVTALTLNKTSAFELFNAGYDTVIASNLWETPLLPQEKIAGNELPQRIVKNPTILRYELPASLFLPLRAQSKLPPPTQLSTCAESLEGHCWLVHRLTQIELPPEASTEATTIKVMTQWLPQKIALYGEELVHTFTESERGQWVSITIPPRGAEAPPCILEITTIRSPKEHYISNDARRLGVAVKR
jgi:4-amino-4-deoxy-L-arabinose transferase-like glycosyltransferase